MRSIPFFLVFCSLFNFSCSANYTSAESAVLWQLGENDGSGKEFALAPANFKAFLEHDFGWEDRYFIVGTHDIAKDFPYVLPGPSDAWGGTSGTAGWRSHFINILFELENVSDEDAFKLSVDLTDCSAENPPLLKVLVNGHPTKFSLPYGNGILENDGQEGKEYNAEIKLSADQIVNGVNQITITTLQGSWMMFDQVLLEGPSSVTMKSGQRALVKSAHPTNYEVEEKNQRYQPFVVELLQVAGAPQFKAAIDGETRFETILEEGEHHFEVPMPAVKEETESTYELFINDVLVKSGIVQRAPQQLVTPADYVNTMMGTAHSRWMIAPGPWMPFSMVKLSPDNQDKGWQAGYDPIFESIGGFSHIHEWTLSGLLVMPTHGPLVTEVGSQFDPDSGYRSRIDKRTEVAPLGHYKVDLADYDITAEVTATSRAAFHRYTYPEDVTPRILLNLHFPSEYDFLLDEVRITKVNEQRIEGYSKQRTPNTWAGGITQEYIIHFVAEFDQAFVNSGVWTNEIQKDNERELLAEEPGDAGMYVEFSGDGERQVQMRIGFSYVSVDNAGLNLREEMSEPFGWNFDAIVQNQRNEWNELLGRIKIESNDQREKMRFYTNLYRSFCRNTYSDVNGEWVDPDEQMQKLTNPDHIALGCDAFWNTFWNLNQLWNLVSPEWSNRWINSQLAMYDTHGWLAKGPAGMEYIPVMVAEHEIPLIVGAYQMGIRDFDVDKAFEAMQKMQTVPGKPVAGGYAGNRNLETYIQHEYVPSDEGRFSNTMEYSFDDWAVSQMAKALDKKDAEKRFAQRGEWWRNAIDTESGYARLKKADGTWEPDFDPFKSGANHQYVEGNAWQLTFFVPQDVPALIDVIGKDRFLERLEWGFNESEKWRYNAPNDLYWDFPVIQGNQQSMHFAYLFNWAGQPWQTQKWARSIMDRYYGYGLANAYLGDEDQGQMSAWFVMAALGLFQTDGGCNVDPVYEIGSPLFERAEIDLGQQFGRGETFVIEAKNASKLNKYVQSAQLNGKQLTSFKFPARELLKGGNLVLEMGAEPNKAWGIE